MCCFCNNGRGDSLIGKLVSDTCIMYLIDDTLVFYDETKPPHEAKRVSVIYCPMCGRRMGEP